MDGASVVASGAIVIAGAVVVVGIVPVTVTLVVTIVSATTVSVPAGTVAALMTSMLHEPVFTLVLVTGGPKVRELSPDPKEESSEDEASGGVQLVVPLQVATLAVSMSRLEITCGGVEVVEEMAVSLDMEEVTSEDEASVSVQLSVPLRAATLSVLIVDNVVVMDTDAATEPSIESSSDGCFMVTSSLLKARICFHQEGEV